MDNEEIKEEAVTEAKEADAAEEKAEKKGSLKKHLPLYILEAIVLIGALFVLVAVTRATRVKKVDVDESRVAVNEGVLEEPSLPEGHVYDGSEEDPVSEPEIDKEAIYEELYQKYDGIFQMAFFGVDSREGELGAGTRSDSIMICSIDMKTHEVKLISIYRDTYLNLGDDTYNKCNASYAKGGPEQALSMINRNTDLYITDYVTVGFEGLIRTIDALGGVTINVEEEEIFHLNNYQISMADELGVNYTPVVYAGYQSLNGLQATAYCRIRATSGYDFRRTERQRIVVAAMLEKAKQVRISKLTAAVSELLPNVQTSLSLDDFVKMISLASDYQVSVSAGFPFEGMLNGGNMGTVGAFVVPVDLTKNVKKLHETLYNAGDYEPSEDVKRISRKIKEDTDPYLSY